MIHVEAQDSTIAVNKNRNNTSVFTAALYNGTFSWSAKAWPVTKSDALYKWINSCN